MRIVQSSLLRQFEFTHRCKFKSHIIMAQQVRSYASLFSGESNNNNNNNDQKAPTSKSTETNNTYAQRQHQQKQPLQHPAPSIPTYSTPTHSKPSTQLHHDIHWRRPPPAEHAAEHRPNTSIPDEEQLYVLTFLTSAHHHATMTQLRKEYFPPRINKLDAHLTLFHALPGSKLTSTILPSLSSIASKTSPFSILADKPFRLKSGIAIGVSKSQGSEDAKVVHRQLQAQWKEFLSQQDAGGFRAHYTIMNKVDDEEFIGKAFQEVVEKFKGNEGMVNGLSLYRYDRGYWKHIEDFKFSGSKIPGM